MRKFFILLHVSLRSMLHTFSFGRGKKRAASGAATLILIGGMALYISGVYSFLFADTLTAMGLLEFLLPLMSLFACVAALLFTAFGASGVVFGNKDSDLLLSLPVSSFSIMLSKILALYLENFLFCGLWMIPTCIAYALQAQAGSIHFALRAMACIPFLTFLPTLLGVLLGYCIAFFSARATHKALISNLMYFLMFGLLIVGSMQINKLSALLVTNADLLRQALRTWLLPFGLLHQGIANGDWLAIVLFCVLCSLPFFVVVFFLSAQYKRILTSISSHASRSDFKLTHMSTRGTFYALLRKEIFRYFGTPIYFFNTGFGMLFLLGGAIYLCFSRQSVLAVLELTGLTPLLAPIVCAVFLLCIGTVCPTSVSISLEGKTLWILKEAPISALQVLLSKLLTNILVAWPATIISLILIGWSLSLSVGTTLCIFLLCTAFIAHIATFGLIVNLLLPKMDASSDMLVVKQSAAAMCGSFGGILFAGLCIGAYFLFGIAMEFALFLVIAAVVLLTIFCLEWVWLVRKGTQILMRV